jgi:hypothetical protein
MDRRDFLKAGAAVGVASVSSGPYFLGAQEKAKVKAIVGTGAHQYECNHQFGELPASIQWQTTHGCAVDSAGLIYLTHQGVGKNTMDTVVVFDPTGKFVHSFGKEWHGGGHGIDIRKEGSDEFIYLCHMSNNGPVVKTTLKGEVVWKKGPPPDVYKDKMAYKPTNLAFAPDGGFYVGDGYGSNLIHQYDVKGEYLKTFGASGNGPGQMRTPHGIYFDTRPGVKPALIVADRANNRLQTFTPAGEHVGFSPKGDVLFPAHIDARGDLLLVSDLHARLTLLGKDNQVVAHLGDDADWRKEVLGMKVRTQPDKWQAGKFVHPHDACFDAAGNIIVAEWVGTGRVSFLKKLA